MPEIISFSAFLCERVLVETDSVLSAIRMVDMFIVPDERPPDFVINFWLVATAKLAVGIPPTELTFTFTLVRPNGEREALQQHKAATKMPIIDTGVPVGAGIVVQFQIAVKNLGTLYIEIEVEGKEIKLERRVCAKVPFTLWPTSVLAHARN
jgi:hypothetical protein